jgi:hypothetical protein
MALKLYKEKHGNIGETTFKQRIEGTKKFKIL